MISAEWVIPVPTGGSQPTTVFTDIDHVPCVGDTVQVTVEKLDGPEVTNYSVAHVLWKGLGMSEVEVGLS